MRSSQFLAVTIPSWTRIRVAIGFVACLLPGSAHLRGDVIVLANRTSTPIQAEIQPVRAAASAVTLGSHEVVPVFVDGRAHVSFGSRSRKKRYLLSANSAYYFGTLSDGEVVIQQIGLGEDRTTSDGRSLPGSALTTRVAEIPVKILVDEEEPALRSRWEARLRARVEAASKVLEKHCRLRLKIVAFGTWESDNRINDFHASLSEFERKVTPFPGKLVIGFTSQYQVPHGRVHLGGTRGPFHSHILIREWSQHVAEKERQELLVHELGHHLGASHSPERDSVMRPVIAGRNAKSPLRGIRFDPVNTLVMSMIVEEVRRRDVADLNELSIGTKRRLRQIYATLSDSLPQDAAADKFIRMVDTATVSPLVGGTKGIVRSIVQAARENRKRPVEADAAESGPARLTGDRLTEFYVCRAAEAAESLSEEVRATAFLLALGIALDNSELLQKLPQTKQFVTTVESPAERSVRIALVGKPTIFGRRDLAQHFAVSAYLATVLGSKGTESAGLAKELLDAQGQSGFSFADLAADKAGILFAGGVLNNRFSLSTLAKEFTIPQFMPPIDGLAEGLTAAELVKQFGPPDDVRFRDELRGIVDQILELPPYRALDTVSSTR